MRNEKQSDGEMVIFSAEKSDGVRTHHIRALDFAHAPSNTWCTTSRLLYPLAALPDRLASSPYQCVQTLCDNDENSCSCVYISHRRTRTPSTST